jgi:hypothetical protein
VKESYPESKLLEALGQAREGLEASAGLGHQGERGGRTGQISTRILGAGGVTGLVCEGARGGSCGDGSAMR